MEGVIVINDNAVQGVQSCKARFLLGSRCGKDLYPSHTTFRVRLLVVNEQ